MATQIFVNLPVKDLKRSIEFFTKLGYSFNPQFTDDNAACLVISETIYAMLLVEPFFKTFVGEKTIVDAHKATEVIVALSAESTDAVKRIVGTAVEAGGKRHKEPQDHGFMYYEAFTDLDGHVWEHLWMNPSHVQK